MPDPDALYKEGFALLPRWREEGPDLEARRQRAMATLRQAGEAGSLDAAVYLASAAETAEERLRWAEAAARVGDARPLSTLVSNGDHPPWCGQRLLAAARDGQPWAQVALAAVYGSGMVFTDTGVEVATVEGAWGWLPAVADPDAEARRWWERAAAAGFAPAHLALAHEDKVEAPQAALDHVRAALAAGTLHPGHRAQAQGLLLRLLDRLDVALEERIAVRRGLAEAGDGPSATWLGDHHRKGQGLPKDLAAARAWYERGAAQADVDALRELGKLCEKGQGGPKDLDRARALYEQAAELGADRYARDRLVKRFGLQWYARGPGER
ncbi:hypothetical protein L6R53_09270 [Myxococcota bacterium]|nr:hypothetical protein [Myxococcota bacterium]